MPFRTLPLANYQRRQHAAVMDSLGRIVLFGDNWDNSVPNPGFAEPFGGYDLTHKYAERFDPSTNSWTVLAPLLTSIENYAWGIDTSDRLYATCGLVESTPSGSGGIQTSNGDTYDPTSNTWSSMATLVSTERRREGYFWMRGDDLYVAGGEDQHVNLLSDVLRYSAGSWTAFPNPYASLFAFGGFWNSSGATICSTCTVEKHPQFGAMIDTSGRFHIIWPSVTVFSDGVTLHLRFDPASGTWARLNDTPVGIPYTSASTILPDDSIFFFGTSAGNRYDPVTDSWTTIAGSSVAVNSPIYEHGFVYAPSGSGRVLRYSVALDTWTDTGDQWTFNHPDWTYALPIGDGNGYYMVYQAAGSAADGTYDEDNGTGILGGTRRVDYWTPPISRRGRASAQVIG